MLPEVENYLFRLEDLRGQIKNLISQVPPEQLDWRPIESGGEQTNSAAVLVAHCCGAERFWIGEVIGGKAPVRDRQAEFATRTTSHAELFHLLQQTSDETREILKVLPAEVLESSRLVEDEQVPVRWALLHCVDHIALHLGHLQMTYQLMTHGKTITAPLWKQRIPKP